MSNEINPEFDKWVKSLPDKYWAKYDLSACKLGWEAHEQSTTTFIMGRDQYGQHYDDLGDNPKKTLLNILNRTKAEKMYINKKDGSTVQCGWVIGDHWITLYKLEPWEIEQ